MEMTVFYAWQSDRPGNVNHYLIRDAAKDACERISDDESNDWNLMLDSDTKGVAGMCDIPNTILKKIRSADMFLGDLTIVGKTENDPPKLLPNTNVVIELGYAARHLSFNALIGVMNEAFGEVEGQVFDIKRRDCLKYKLPPEAKKAERDRVRTLLSDQLEEVFRTTIESVVIPKRTGKEAGKDESLVAVQRSFAEKVASNAFENFELLPAVLTSIQFKAVPRPDYPAAVETARAVVSENPKTKPDGIVWTKHAEVTKLSLDGYLLRAYGGDYVSMQNQFNLHRRAEMTYSEEENRLLFDMGLQRNIVEHIYADCHLLQKLGINPPWQIGISLVGIKGFRLVPENPEAASEPCEGDFTLPLVKVKNAKQVKDVPTMASLLKDSLDHLCRHFGWEGSDHFTSPGFGTCVRSVEST